MGCFPLGVTYKYLKPTSWLLLDDSVNYYKAQLADGASIAIKLTSNDCSNDASVANKDPLLHNCGDLLIDVNGAKGPNQVGRDLFIFFITSSGIYPKGFYDDNVFADVNGNPVCDPDSAFSSYQWGFGCTGKVLKEGAMNY